MKNYARYILYAKTIFLMVYVGTYDCYENIKIKFWSTISILKPGNFRNFYLQKENDCKVAHCCYWGYQIILLSWLNRLVSCCVIMARIYVRKTSSEQNYIKDRHDPRSKHNQWKSNCSKNQWSCGGWEEHPETFSRGFGGLSPLKKIFGSKNGI